MQCHAYGKRPASSTDHDRKTTTNRPPQTISPMERLMDLLQEVRQISRQVQRSARQSVRSADESSYDDVLLAMLSDRIRSGDARMRIVCYASAAELGVPVQLQSEHYRQAMNDGLSVPLRVLFWTANRRMQAGRRPYQQASALSWI